MVRILHDTSAGGPPTALTPLPASHKPRRKTLLLTAHTPEPVMTAFQRLILRASGSRSRAANAITLRSLITLIEGCLLVALGVRLLQAGGLLVSGTAGMSLLGADLTALSFGSLFFLINLPFYGLAWKQLGLNFTLRTLGCVSLLSVLSDVGGQLAAGCRQPAGRGDCRRPVDRSGHHTAVSRERLAGRPEHSGAAFGATLRHPCRSHHLRLRPAADRDRCTGLPWPQVICSALAFATLSFVLGRYHRRTPQTAQPASPAHDKQVQTAH